MEVKDRINEVEANNSGIKEIDLNLNEVCKSVCKIIYKNNYGTGFFVKLYKNEKELLCLMTNEHVIKKDMIESKEIIDVKYNCEKKWIKIKLDEKERFIKYNKEMDFSIIEIKTDDKIKEKYFLLPNINNIDYINKDIYIVQFPEGKNLSYSVGKIKDIVDFEIIYDASTKTGSSGSPILLKNTTEVIGIHKQGSSKRKENYGTLISYIMQSLNKNKGYKEKKILKNEEELKAAKQNGFILIGRIGAGKSTLINVLFDEKVVDVKGSATAVTIEPKVYYLKLKNGRYVSLIDTPGISDHELKNDILFKDILKTISEEKIQIKGILFLVNFQGERFYTAEQETLIKFQQIFSFKGFWKHLIVIFTHNYDAPFSDDFEEIMQARNEANKYIFTKLMEKSKNDSDIVDYKELKIKYYNSYYPVKNEKQEIQNNKNKEDLEILLSDFCEKDSIFLLTDTIHITKEKIEEEIKKESHSKSTII